MEDFNIADAQRREGTTLQGKWHLDRMLGVGAMAAVYAATHRNGNRAAIKMMHESLARDAQVRERFLREGLIANKVDHPGAVRVLDEDRTETGTPFLVLELLVGDTLEAIARKHGGRIALPLVLAIGAQLCDVLTAAHARGIIHRDIKPANVFITEEGRVKLLDFGIARAAFAGNALTETGMPIGSPAFMAPEQALAQSEKIDARTDIYAVGASLFTIAVGRTVHEGASAADIFVKAAHDAAPRLATVWRDAPLAFATIVDRALAREQALRYSTAAELKVALEQANEAISARPLATSAELAQLVATGSRQMMAQTVNELGPRKTQVAAPIGFDTPALEPPPPPGMPKVIRSTVDRTMLAPTVLDIPAAKSLPEKPRYSLFVGLALVVLAMLLGIVLAIRMSWE